MSQPVCLVAGWGPTLGAGISRVFSAEGYQVVGVSRTAGPDSLTHYQAELSDSEAVGELVEKVEKEVGPIEVLIYNAAQLLIKPFLETEPADFERLWRSHCLGATVSAQQVLPRMLSRGQGSMIFSGATASLRGAAKFSAFASSKFALRALAQSLAREFAPQGIHVGHAILDGLLWGEQSRSRFGAERSACLEPEDVAQVYLDFVKQRRSAWTHEFDLRPDGENW